MRERAQGDQIYSDVFHFHFSFGILVRTLMLPSATALQIRYGWRSGSGGGMKPALKSDVRPLALSNTSIVARQGSGGTPPRSLSGGGCSTRTKGRSCKRAGPVVSA